MRSWPVPPLRTLYHLHNVSTQRVDLRRIASKRVHSRRSVNFSPCRGLAPEPPCRQSFNAILFLRFDSFPAHILASLGL
jgi:hypothetical protein